MDNTKLSNIALLSGIDSLYYHVQTNENYDDMFLDILDQIEDKKCFYERHEIEYQYNQINIEIFGITFNYLSNAEGYHWFKDLNENFKIGFKDERTQKKLHNIRVQLLAKGIYLVGLKPLLKYINETLLHSITTGNYPVIRADLNCFVNYDFGFVTRSMFVSRKKHYRTINEFGKANSLETIYVGKSPFLLRLYNKKLELSKSEKQELMLEYFANGGLDIEKPIFNLEFEMHRAHLKLFSINTIEDLLINANNLFSKAMDEIRLIDISSITQKDIENNSKSRANSLPIWEHIKENYNITEFMQLDYPLERLKRKALIYDENRFIEEMNKLLKKALIHDIEVGQSLLEIIIHEFYNQVKEDKELYKKLQQYNPDYTPLIIEGEIQKYRILKDGSIIKPVNTISVRELSDKDLENEIKLLESELHFGDENKRKEYSQKLSIAYNESKRRGGG